MQDRRIEVSEVAAVPDAEQVEDVVAPTVKVARQARARFSHDRRERFVRAASRELAEPSEKSGDVRLFRAHVHELQEQVIGVLEQVNDRLSAELRGRVGWQLLVDGADPQWSQLEQDVLLDVHVGANRQHQLVRGRPFGRNVQRPPRLVTSALIALWLTSIIIYTHARTIF